MQQGTVRGAPLSAGVALLFRGSPTHHEWRCGGLFLISHDGRNEEHAARCASFKPKYYRDTRMDYRDARMVNCALALDSICTGHRQRLNVLQISPPPLKVE